MFNEGKEIVKSLEEKRELIEKKHYYPDDVLNSEDLIMIMDYINQLETNRDEAIKYIETHSFMDEHLPFANALGPTNVKKLLEILERGVSNE